MESNFAASLDLVFQVEGYYVDDPADRGGATKYGITIDTLSRWLGKPLTPLDVQAMTKGTAARIYKNNYWDAAGCALLPLGVDCFVFDYSVNSGVRTSVKALQRAVGVKADGYIGKVTATAVDRMGATNVINVLAKQRLGFLHRLRNWRRFGAGWTNRVNRVRSTSLRMATP